MTDASPGKSLRRAVVSDTIQVLGAPNALVARLIEDVGFEAVDAGPLSVARSLEELAVLWIHLAYNAPGLDRNYAFGAPDDDAQRAYDVVFQATEAGLATARPGATTTDLWRAMNEVLEGGGTLGNNVGRLGHGLGMQLTEWPSNKAGDDTELLPGMVLTIEPGMEFKPGQMMVHEENIIVTEDGCELLTRRAPDEMWLID